MTSWVSTIVGSHTAWVKSRSPEDRSFRQQSENPLRAAKCSGNIPWTPRLKKDTIMLIYQVSPRYHWWSTKGRTLLFIAQNHQYQLHNTHYISALERFKHAALARYVKSEQLLKKGRQAHLLSRVSSVGDEGVDEELVSISSCNVQWRISILIFTVNLSTFGKRNKLST